nr:hypothetical protein GCM10020093_115890 [Planobispora longispora]
MLLLDEPLGALDLKLREEMQVELKSIQREVGITFLFVTHDQEEALTMSDRVAVFDRGRVEQVGTPAEIYERPATAFVAGFVGTSNLISGSAAQAVLGRRDLQRAAGEAARGRARRPGGRRRAQRDRDRQRGRLRRARHPVRGRARRGRPAHRAPAEPAGLVHGRDGPAWHQGPARLAPPHEFAIVS